MKRKDNVFTSVPRKKVSRNRFDLSHEIKMSGKFGIMYPVLIMDTLPGDQIADTMTILARFAPMLSPIMHKVDMKVDAFFVPSRLVYGQELFESFITGGNSGTESPILPYITPAGLHAITGGSQDFIMRKGQLWDYLGLPVLEVGVTPSSTEQILVGPFRAYQKIYNDWLRDPNLDPEIDLTLETQGNVSVGFNTSTQWALKRRGWRKDYYTACLPFAQRGTEVLMPLAGEGSVTYLPVSQLYAQDGAPGPVDMMTDLDSFVTGEGAGSIPNEYVRVQNIDTVNFENSTVSINDFRTSLALQSWMENSARGGGRYVEATEAHFNVRIPDYTLQRSEYVGGLRAPVTISEVLSTTATESVPVGDMAGHGISVAKKRAFSYRCQEHGYMIAVLTIIPQSAYYQGIDPMWSRHNRFDNAFPELMHLGEKAIKSKELYYSFVAADDDENNETFGYLPRGSDYKFKNDRVAGDFRDTLAFWHLGRIFTERPALDSLFVTMHENEESGEESYRRIFAVQDGTDYLWIQIFHYMSADRPLPYFSVPQLVG